MSDDPTGLPTTPAPEPASPAATDVWAPPVAPPPPAPPPGSAAPRRRRRAPIVALVVILVAAVAVGGYALSSGGGDDGGADTGTLEPDDVVPAPVQATDLHAKASSFQVVLDWAKGAGDPQPASYLVYRDGIFQDTVPARTTKFVDETVIPGTKYRYRVQVADADDQEFPVGAPSVKTKTPPAPPSTARLEGVYNARFSEVSHYGYSGGGPLLRTLGFRLKPTCKEGACDTDLVVLRFQGFRTKLTLKGDTYTGSASVRGFLRCGGVTTTSSVTLTLRPTEAGEVQDEWRVTGFTGTLVQRVGSQLGCVAAGSNFTMVGKPV